MLLLACVVCALTPTKPPFSVTSSTAEYVTNIHWVNVSFAHSMVETASCFESSCSGQSASFLTTAALNLNGIKYAAKGGVCVCAAAD